MDVYMNDKKIDFLEREVISVDDLLKQIEASRPDAEVSIEINGEPLSKKQWAEHHVNEGDEVRIYFEE